jgi:hypothetical protein
MEKRMGDEGLWVLSGVRGKLPWGTGSPTRTTCCCVQQSQSRKALKEEKARIVEGR